MVSLNFVTHFESILGYNVKNKMKILRSKEMYILLYAYIVNCIRFILKIIL